MSDAEMQETLSKALVHSGQEQARRAIAEFNAKLQDSLAALGARTGLTFTLPADKVGQYRMLDALIGTGLISVHNDQGASVNAATTKAKQLLEQQASQRILRRMMVGAATLIEDAMKALAGEEESTIEDLQKIQPGE